jgi:hypothetical protein
LFTLLFRCGIIGANHLRSVSKVGSEALPQLRIWNMGEIDLPSDDLSILLELSKRLILAPYFTKMPFCEIS